MYLDLKNNKAKWLCCSKKKSLSTFVVVKCLVMCCSISLTPSKFCSNKQKLFRMYTSRKQRYPASRLLTWNLRMPTNLRCMTRFYRHPTWAPLRDSLFLRTSWMRFSSRLLFSLLPVACFDTLAQGQIGRVPHSPGCRPLGASLWWDSCWTAARTGLLRLSRHIVPEARICRMLILWRANTLIKY